MSHKINTTEGFTLVELMVVVGLIALLTGVVVANLQSPVQIADYQLVIRKIERLDQQTRWRASKGNQQARLVIDFDAREIRAFTRVNDEFPFDILRVGGKMRFARLVTDGKSHTTGTVEIKVGQHGRSPSYALLVTRGELKKSWLFVAGGTGQFSQMKDDDEVLSLLQI